MPPTLQKKHDLKPIEEEVDVDEKNDDTFQKVWRDPRSNSSKKTLRLIAKELHEIIQQGRPAKVRSFLLHQIRCDEFPIQHILQWNNPNDGNTALHYAVQGHLAIVRLLLQLGADPNVWNHHGYTPTMVVILWIDQTSRAADVKQTSPDSMSSLDPTSYNNNRSHSNLIFILNALLYYGALPNARSLHGQLPLHLAIDTKQWHSVHRLLKFGARMDLADPMGQTAWQRCFQEGNQPLNDMDAFRVDYKATHLDRKFVRCLSCCSDQKSSTLVLFKSSKTGATTSQKNVLLACDDCGCACCNQCRSIVKVYEFDVRTPRKKIKSKKELCRQCEKIRGVQYKYHTKFANRQ